MKFVLTLNGESKAARALSVRPDCLYLRMSELSRNEKAAAIRCYFAQYGKVLSESGFGNQVAYKFTCLVSLTLYLRNACTNTHSRALAALVRARKLQKNTYAHTMCRIYKHGL